MGYFRSDGSVAGRAEMGIPSWGETTTLCDDGIATAGGQCTVTGTLTHTSTGTCRQTVRGTQTFFTHVTCRVTFTGQQTVVVTGTCRQTVYGTLRTHWI